MSSEVIYNEPPIDLAMIIMDQYLSKMIWSVVTKKPDFLFFLIISNGEDSHLKESREATWVLKTGVKSNTFL